jgi:hypothetical protein
VFVVAESEVLRGDAVEEYELFAIRNDRKNKVTDELLNESLEVNADHDERGAVLELCVAETGKEWSSAKIYLCPGQWTMLKTVGDAILKAQMLRDEQQASVPNQAPPCFPSTSALPT